MMILVGGVDFGRHKDPTVGLVLDIDRLPIRVVRYKQYPKSTWDMVLSKLTLMLEGVNPTLADATGVGDALYERLPNSIGVILTGRADGIRMISSSRMTIPTRMLFDQLSTTINNRELAVECSCPGLQRQLQRFGTKMTASGWVRFQGQKNFHDDGVFALALANFAARLSLRK